MTFDAARAPVSVMCKNCNVQLGLRMGMKRVMEAIRVNEIESSRSS